MTAENKQSSGYYVMPVKPERKSSMGKDGVPEAMSSMAGSDGLIQVELERDVVIERLARDLYKDPKAGVREYVNNEARQCRDAIRLGHKASIHITVNGTTRTITIEGRGSMGMTMQMFRDVYTVLGRSGNMDGGESGQFGFGRAAYLCLSDRVIFETFSRETDERFGFLGKGGKVYEPIPEQFLSIKEYGSKATMTVRKEINMHELVQYSSEVSRFLDVPVYLEIASPVESKNRNTFHVGVTKVGPVDKRKQIIKDHVRYMEQRKSWLEIDNDDYKLEGYVTDDRYRKSMKTLLVGMPVDSFPIKTPIDGFMFLTIKNERKYQPTASRDSMSKDAQTKLSEMIWKDVCEYLRRIEISRLSDFAKSKDVTLIEKMAHIEEDCGIPDDVLAFSRLVNARFVVATDEKRPKKFGSKNIVKLANVLENHEKIIYARTRNMPVINTLLDKEPDVAVLTPHCMHGEELEAVLENLRRFGALNLREYLDSKKINVKKEKQEGMVAYAINGTPEIIGIRNIYAGIVRIPRSVRIQPFLNTMKEKSVWGVKFAKDTKRLEDTPSRTLDSVCRKARRTRYSTSEGTMTGAKILKNYGSGFAILKKSGFNKPDMATHERCRRALEYTGLIVDEPENVSRNVPPTVALMLAYHVSGKHEAGFRMIDQNDEAAIRTEHSLESLGIRVHGRWRHEVKIARKHLEPFDNVTVREMYARFYNWTYSWNHIYRDTPQDFGTDNAAKIFTAVDKWAADKSEFDVCIGLLGLGLNHGGQSGRACSVSRHGVPLWVKRLAAECIMDGSDKKERLQFVLDALFETGKIEARIVVSNVEINNNRYSKKLTLTTDARPIVLDDESLTMHAVWAVMMFGTHMPRIHGMEITTDTLKIRMGD